MEPLQKLHSKILSWNQAQRASEELKTQEKTLVFSNGCFDILHHGHVVYLAKAAVYGDALMIGLNTDESVRKLKGKYRPVNPEHSRALLLAALEFVDYVVLFGEDTPYELIRTVKPAVLVKGKDYKIEDVVGHDIVMAAGGQVKTIDLVEGYSTSGIIDKLKK